MRRWLLLATCALSAVACDPLLPMRALDEIQPVNRLELSVTQYSEQIGYLRSGASVAVQADAFDTGDNLITLGTAKKVTWTVSDPEVLKVSTAGEDGIAWFLGQKAGTATVTAEVDKKSASVSVTVSPGAPAQISAIAGTGQLGVVGDALLQQIEYEARDAYGNSVGPNVTMTFTATGGTVTPASRLTDATGRAKTTYTPSTTGSQTVTGRISTTISLAVPVTVTTVSATLGAALPDLTNDVAVSPAPTVQLRYASNAAVYPRQGLTVSATVTSSGGQTLTNATAATNASGLATFADLRMSGTAGAVTVRFAVQTVGGFVDATTNLKGGIATKLGISTQASPSTATGRVFSQPPVIQLQDKNSNASAQAGVVVKATATPSPGTAGTFTLADDQATTDGSGQATFSQLKVTGTEGGSFILSFNSPTTQNLTAVASTAITLTGIETKLAVSRVASSMPCDAPATTTLQVKLQDSGNRDVSRSGVLVTAALAAGTTGVAISAGATATTDANGVATFAALVLRGTAGSYTLDLTAPSLTKATTGVALIAGAPSSLALTTQPALSVANGATMSATPAIRVLDACNNQTTTGSLSVSLAASPNTVVFTNGTRTTTNGTASFPGLILAGPARKYQLLFTATGVTSATATDSTTLTKGAGARLALTTQPSTAAGSNTPLPTQPRIEVRDVGGNAVGGVVRSISASISGTTPANGATITNGTASLPGTDSSVAFSGLKITGVAGSYRLVFKASGLSDDTASAATVLSGAGTASRIVLDTAPASGALSNLVLGRTPVIRLRDEAGANVALAGMQVSVAATNANTTLNLSGQPAVTDATGKAGFPSLAVTSGGLSTPVPFTFTVAGLTPVTAPASTVLAATVANNSVPSVAGSANSSTYYGIVVPAGRTQIQFTWTAGSGDANIYVGATDVPGITAATATCAGENAGTANELCTINNPAAGQYFVRVYGVTSFSGTLKISYIP